MVRRGFFPATLAAFWAAVAIPVLLTAQAITINTSGKGPMTVTSTVDRQYQQIEPTHVALSQTPIDTRARLEVVRIMQAEQGFAMRPLPRGHKGLTLIANGKLEPAGEAYLNMVAADGVCAKPGDRVVITNVKFEHERIVFDLNGGPDAKHRFLRHISVGAGGPDMMDTPVVAGGDEPTGSRLSLAFKDHVPGLTGAQVKALLSPLISFDVKSPIQAYTDTLPKPLKQAILDHQVLVGMNTDMVLFARGQPKNKMREMDGQMPIEIWLYGTPPEDVTFVRINGNRVIRVDLAKVGKPVQVFDQDVVTGMLRADGKPVEQASNVRVVKEGDVIRDPDKEMPAAPPSLRQPGEKPPDSSNNPDTGEMKPVHFPTKQTTQPGQNPDDQPPAQPAPADSGKSN